MGVTPHQIRTEPHAEIGLILQRDAGRIVERWARRAVEEQPTAQRLHHADLLDHLPPFLDALGRSLAEADVDGWKQARPAREHGAQRWKTGWSLAEVVRDYQILRLVILDYLDETLERSLGHRETLAVGLALDEAINASVTAYTRGRDEYQQGLEQARVEEVRKAQEALRQREEALRAADDRKNEFVATLAHEIRNLVAPLRNAIGVLHLCNINDPTVQQVRGISERQVQLMSRLLDDLLDVTRIAQGKIKLSTERVPLSNLLNHGAQMVEPLMHTRRHRLDVLLPKETLWLDADQTRLVQIVVNLLNNAAKYTNPGGEITLSAEREGDEAVIRVKDSGVGIAPEMLPHVFNLFTQAEWSLDRSQGGLGIGLTLVKRLVELHGGSIAVHSAGLGKGSEFVVRLPLAPLQGTDSPPQEQPATQGAAKRHVLIIEDNADGRESLAILLRLLGHRVDVAENGAKGIEQALSVPPEVALIDLRLPDLDGYQVAQQLRSSIGERVLLVALTGSGQPEDRRRTREAGFHAHLTKPVDLADLEKVLSKPN